MAEHYAGTAASKRVECLTTGQGITCERSMYYSGRIGGTVSIGGGFTGLR